MLPRILVSLPLTLLLWFSCHLFAAETVRVESNEGFGQLGSQVEVLLTDYEVSFAQIIAANQSYDFKAQTTPTIVTRENDRYLWLRFSLKIEDNGLVATDGWVLYFDSPRVNVQEIYWQKDNGEITAIIDPLDERVESSLGRQQAGHEGSDQEGMISEVISVLEHPQIPYLLQLKPGDSGTVFIKVHSSNRLISKLHLVSVETFLEESVTLDLLHGLFYGGVLIMIFYNFFLLVSIREISYLYYTLYVFLVGVTFAMISGHLEAHLYFDDFALAGKIILSASIAAILSYLMFIDRMFSLRDAFRMYSNVLKLCWITSLIAIAYVWLESSFGRAEVAFQVAFLVLVVGGITPLFILCARRNVTAMVVVAAFVLPVTGTATAVTNALNLTTFSPNFTFFFVKFALLIEFSMLSFVLANSYKNLIRRKDALGKEAFNNLKRSEKLKNEFLSTISHELRTPMNGVQGALELIDMDLDEGVDVDHIDTIENSTDEMVSLIDSILNFVELESGVLVYKPLPFRLSEAMMEVVEPVRKACTDKGLRFEYHCPEHQLDCVGDLLKIQKILKHLLSNAVKFTSSGKVIFSIEEDFTEGEMGLILLVEDSGIGIGADNQAEVFGMFQQADGSFTRKYGGLGIGLTIAHRLVKLLGGKLEMQTEEGIGTRFSLFIPLEGMSREKQNESFTQTNTQDDSALDVLVVEDNPVNQKMMKALLKKMGHRVTTSDNGLLAFEWCQENQADLIFMDCQMPVMDGFESTRRIRSLDIYTKVPIIAVTANASDQDREACYNAGMDDFIAKPINLSIIQKSLSKWRQKLRAA